MSFVRWRRWRDILWFKLPTFWKCVNILKLSCLKSYMTNIQPVRYFLWFDDLCFYSIN